MERDEVLDEFRAAGALLNGHFILTSGLRSPVYLQCARVMMEPKRGERLCAALAALVRESVGAQVDIVASPAMGGVVVGYEMARQLGTPSVFFERVDGAFALRRGFSLPKGARTLMVEDVVTTGLSSRECIEAIRAAGGEVVAGASLVDRSNGKADIGVPLVSLLRLEAPAYPADDLPPELAAIEPVKPGSRSLA